MAFPPARVKQSTTTTGTGTLTLNAASTEVRSFQAGFGSGTAILVRYILSSGGAYEVGYGTLNTTAGTLSRDEVEASSNAGSLVSLSGTTDVFFDFLPGDRQIRTVSSNTTLTRADLGVVIRCTQTADITLTLPPVATVPGGANQLSMGYTIRNFGTNNSIVWIDPNGSEYIDALQSSFPVFGGETVQVFSIGTSWMMLDKPTGMRVVGTKFANLSASVDFALPYYGLAERCRFRVDFRQVRPSTDGAALWMRTDDAGGASFDFGGADYITSVGYVSGATAWAGSEGSGSSISLSTDMDNGTSAHNLCGYVDINPGAGGVRYPVVFGQAIARGNGASFAGWQTNVFGGIRNAAQDINAISFLMSTGNIELGDFVLSACYD